MEQQPILSAQSLSIGYCYKQQENTIASGISIDLTQGKLTALTGSNGIGKSTLLRTLTGIQKPLDGTVLLNGKSIAAYRPQELAQHLAIVLTDALPPGNLSVFELVALGRQPYTNWFGSLSADDTIAVNNALRLTDTVHLADKKHFEISDGQLQRVLIARAIAQDTPLIILDEPTTHLDLEGKARLLNLLKKMAAESGKCILYSTHDIDLALQIADEIIVMKKGMVLQGTPDELTENKIFESFFDPEYITFDPEKRNFKVKTNL